MQGSDFFLDDIRPPADVQEALDLIWNKEVVSPKVATNRNGTTDIERVESITETPFTSMDFRESSPEIFISDWELTQKDDEDHESPDDAVDVHMRDTSSSGQTPLYRGISTTPDAHQSDMNQLQVVEVEMSGRRNDQAPDTDLRHGALFRSQTPAQSASERTRPVIREDNALNAMGFASSVGGPKIALMSAQVPRKFASWTSSTFLSRHQPGKSLRKNITTPKTISIRSLPVTDELLHQSTKQRKNCKDFGCSNALSDSRTTGNISNNCINDISGDCFDTIDTLHPIQDSEPRRRNASVQRFRKALDIRRQAMGFESLLITGERILQIRRAIEIDFS